VTLRLKRPNVCDRFPNVLLQKPTCLWQQSSNKWQTEEKRDGQHCTDLSLTIIEATKLAGDRNAWRNSVLNLGLPSPGDSVLVAKALSQSHQKYWKTTTTSKVLPEPARSLNSVLLRVYNSTRHARHDKTVKCLLKN